MRTAHWFHSNLDYTFHYADSVCQWNDQFRGEFYSELTAIAQLLDSELTTKSEHSYQRIDIRQ
jgi:hypothetical protein